MIEQLLLIYALCTTAGFFFGWSFGFACARKRYAIDKNHLLALMRRG